VQHPDPDLLALAALPGEPPVPTVQEHLGGCPACSRYVQSLRRTVDLALDAGASAHGPDVAPPPERVWQAITEELAMVAAPQRATDSAPARPVRAATSRWRRFALPVAAAVAGVAAGVAIGIAVAGPGAGVPVARLASVAGADPAGSGTVVAVGGGAARQLVVRVEGVTNLEGADFLEVWLMDRTGTKLVSLGSLTRDGSGFRGTFTLPANLPTAEFDTVDVSAEKWDGNPDHSRLSLLRGPMT
jgi:Anti-sigma-K factor rskA